MNEDTLLQLFKDAARDIALREFKSLSWDNKIDSLGIDSVALFEIFGQLEEELDLEFDEDKLKNIRTLADLRNLISQSIEIT